MVDFGTQDSDLKKGKIGINYTYYCLIKWPPIAQNRDVAEMERNQTVANAMVQHRHDIEAWCDDNCKDAYKIPDEATMQGVPVMFISKKDWAQCCAEWDIFTQKEQSVKQSSGQLGVDANGKIIIN
tara:strand:+ start:737 stop:1114 length:378 start_codon:yes stop_codon:yes gene_type:complete